MPCTGQILDFYNLSVIASDIFPIELISLGNMPIFFFTQEELRRGAQENSSHLQHILMTKCSNATLQK